MEAQALPFPDPHPEAAQEEHPFDHLDVRPAEEFGPDAPEGLYRGVPEEDYFDHPALSRSDLRPFVEESPAHFIHEFEEEDDEEDESTRSMDLGDHTHKLLLEPEVFENTEVAPAECEKVKNSGEKCDSPPKGYWPEEEGGLWLCGTHKRYADGEKANLRWMDEEQRRKALAMKAALLREPLIAQLFENAWETELTVLWTDADTGLRCRCRIDLVSHLDGDPILADLKTTSSAKPDDFQKKLERLGYWLQHAMYKSGFEHATGGLSVSDFLFLVVENEPPHVAQNYNFDDNTWAAARRHYNTTLRDLDESLEHDRWRGYAEDPVVPLSLRKWQRKRLGMSF